MAEIIISKRAEERLNALTEILYKDEYFGFMDSAIDYVNKLREFIKTLPEQKRFPCIKKIYGQYYCRYKANRNTFWYITFDTDGDLFVVENIINNHTKEYPDFILGL